MTLKTAGSVSFDVNVNTPHLGEGASVIFTIGNPTVNLWSRDPSGTNRVVAQNDFEMRERDDII